MSQSTPHFSNPLFRKIYLYGAHKLIHGCDGLLLEADYHTRNYCIGNRATCQKLDLPDPCKDHLSMTLSYIPSTIEYKLVSISMNYKRWEVLTDGEDKSWRPFLSNLQGCNMKSKRPKVVSAGSAVHCIRIIEVCSKFAAEENINVMVLEDYKKLKRDKEKIVFPLTFFKDSSNSVEDLVPLVAWSGMFRFWLIIHEIICYDLETMKIRWTCADSKWKSVFPPFYSMPPSLITLKGMQPDN